MGERYRSLLLAEAARVAWEAGPEAQARPCAARGWTCHAHTLTEAWWEAMLEHDRRQRVADMAAARDRASFRASDALRRCGAPADAICTVRDPRPTPAMAAARRFVAARPAETRWLLLLGPKGAGKTVAATHVCREALIASLSIDRPSGGTERRADAAAFVTGAALSRLSAFGDDRDEFERLATARVLVIDDVTRAVSATRDTAQTPSAVMMFQLCDVRHSNRLKTVFTDNRRLLGVGEVPGFADWCARITGSASPASCPLWDRIQSAMMVVELPGVSMRPRRRATDALDVPPEKAHGGGSRTGGSNGV